jgi:hypothetical protein
MIGTDTATASTELLAVPGPTTAPWATGSERGGSEAPWDADVRRALGVDEGAHLLAAAEPARLAAARR